MVFCQDNVMDDDGRTKLDLKVQAVGSSDANKEVRDVSLTRSVTTLSDPVSYRIMDGTHTGYIKLSEFNARCPTRVREAVEDLQKQGAQRYILDLRGNPGGTFQTAAKIAGIFMSDRLVTTVADSAGAKTEFRTEEDSQAKKQGERSHQAVIDAPLALWVDRGSASASEVLAGALHDNCRAVVAGDRTFGKGLIQGVFGLEDGSGLIITVARYLTPGGVDINGAGVQPDIARDLGLNFLGGVINVDQDLTEPEWALAQERQGGKLCPPNSEVQVLAAAAGLGQSTGR
jgi:carboxyl-terminal processing protease